MPVRRIWMVGAVALVLFATFAQAREVTLVLKDGRSLNGELVAQSSDSVTIRIAGIESTYPRSQVQEVRVKLTMAERFEKQRSAIPDNDLSARYNLARSFYDQGGRLAQQASELPQAIEAYELALKELDSILKQNPNMQRALLLRGVVSQRLKGLKIASTEPMRPSQPRPTPKSDAPAADAAEKVRLLTPEEIKLIRMFEVNLRNKPAVRLPQDVVRKLFEDYREAPEMQEFLGRDGMIKFRRLEGYEQLGLLFDLRARDLYKDVIINSEPETLKEYRIKIHQNYLLRYCGACHGEGKAAGLYLITRPNNEQTAFTNLMILRTTETSGGAPLLFFERPERSLLLQYGLPAKDAVTPHPEVPGTMVWRPYFNGSDDPRFDEFASWVASLWPESYPVSYDAPKLPSSAATAEQPEPAKSDGVPAKP